jgi:hypothetical protein
MARPRKFKPLTNAERQAAYRERKKAEGLKRQSGWIDPQAVIKESDESKESQSAAAWREELKAEELKAARKEGRQKERAKHQRRGYLQAMISVCSFFIRRERPDISKALLKEFVLSRKDFTEANFDSFELSPLERAGIFNEPEKPPGKAGIDPVIR